MTQIRLFSFEPPHLRRDSLKNHFRDTHGGRPSRSAEAEDVKNDTWCSLRQLKDSTNEAGKDKKESDVEKYD